MRSPVAIVCVLLALLAAPCAEVGGLVALLAGASDCGMDSCCCAVASAGVRSCCSDGLAQRAPQLANACRCGNHGRHAMNAEPAEPRSCSDPGTALPGLRPTTMVRLAPADMPGSGPACPEPPPPRRQG